LSVVVDLPQCRHEPTPIVGIESENIWIRDHELILLSRSIHQRLAACGQRAT